MMSGFSWCPDHAYGCVCSIDGAGKPDVSLLCFDEAVGHLALLHRRACPGARIPVPEQFFSNRSAIFGRERQIVGRQGKIARLLQLPPGMQITMLGL